ncbi:MAG: hypothetical protein NTW17_01890 [Candidatus Pacearchaeota archaeon]|nr:hypothetical protein [Candidatus Pacearchaeota archaeon]
MKIKEVCASSYWFLIGAILFIIASVRYYAIKDITGAILNIIIALFFFIGYKVQIKFNKPKKR